MAIPFKGPEGPDLFAATAFNARVNLDPLSKLIDYRDKRAQQEREAEIMRQKMGMEQERLGFERTKFEEGQRRQQDLARILDPTNPNFKDVPPQLVELSRATRDPSPIVQHYVNSQKSTDDIREFQYARQQGFPGSFMDFMNKKRAGNGQFGLNALWGTNERGEPVAFQPSNQGGVRQIDLPPGVKWQHGVEKVDMGDRWGLLDKKSGQIVGYLPKNIAGAKVEEAVGEDRGKIITTAPKLIATVEALEQQHRLVRDEIRKALELTDKAAASGLPSIVTSKIPGTAGYQLAQLIKTIKANVGFDKLNQMRAESPTGGALGQVAVQELEYLQAVLGSLEQAQDPATIQENLFRLNEYMSSYGERRRRMLEADLKRAGVSPDLLNRQQGLNPINYGMADRKGAPQATDQREFVGMQTISGPGTPVPAEPAAAPAQPPPMPLPPERRVYPKPTPEIVDELRRFNSPADRESFDRAFGPGAAEAYLKGRR